MSTEILEPIDQVESVDDSANQPQSMRQHLGELRVPCSTIASVLVLIFLVRSLYGNFFQQQPEVPVALPLAKVVEDGDGLNQFISVTGFKLDDREYVHRVSRPRKYDYADVHKRLHAIGSKDNGYDCILRLRLSLYPGQQQRNENAFLCKSISKSQKLVGTLTKDSILHESVFKEFPDLRPGKTRVLEYAAKPLNYFLLDFFLAVMCVFLGTLSFVCWVCWNPSESTE